MSFNVAYTSRFGSCDNSQWRVDILSHYSGKPMPIQLDADQPLVIDWPQTELQDSVCPSQCTVRVVNERDRQMIPLAHDEFVVCKVYKNNNLYWTGVLDQGVYEEPYSYLDGYVTELTFSDFGALNRFDFPELSGALPLYDIVALCLVNISIDPSAIRQNVSLMTPGGNPAVLEHIFVNAARLKGMSLRDALNAVLQPFSYRIVQKDGRIFVYDIEWHTAHDESVPVVWKGDDAVLECVSACRTIEISFDHRTDAVIADGGIDTDHGFLESSRYYPIYSDDVIGWNACFYIDIFYETLSSVNINRSECLPVRFCRGVCGVNEACIARRILCYDSVNKEEKNILRSATPMTLSGMDILFYLESEYIPVSPDRKKYQLRVNLDMLLSPYRNPFGPEEDDKPLNNKDNQMWASILMSFVPAKLELLDEQGAAIKHYINADIGGNGYIYPRNEGRWEDGPAESLGKFVLSYYDKKDKSPFGGSHGWKKNRQTYDYSSGQLDAPEFFSRIPDGEYIPLPENAGRLRLTVCNGVVFSHSEMPSQYGNWSTNINNLIRWQLYRNPKIEVVHANQIDNEIDDIEIVENSLPKTYGDTFSESDAFGTLQQGVTPAAKGLLFSASGSVYNNFVLNGIKDTLIKHRLRVLTSLLSQSYSRISGTAELYTGREMLRSEASTPGKFLVTSIRQDPAAGTEYITITRINNPQDSYEHGWMDPVCVKEQEGYRHEWEEPVPVQEPQYYSYEWSDPVCARIAFQLGPVWHHF